MTSFSFNSPKRSTDCFSEYMQKFGSVTSAKSLITLGRVSAALINSCTSYQQVGSEKSLGSEEPLLLLFSTVSALEVDCSFKTKRGELDKLARMNGFKVDQLLTNGRFSEQMREHTSSMRGFIKEKGCKTVREIVRRNFPTVSR